MEQIILFSRRLDGLSVWENILKQYPIYFRNARLTTTKPSPILLTLTWEKLTPFIYVLPIEIYTDGFVCDLIGNDLEVNFQ